MVKIGFVSGSLKPLWWQVYQQACVPDGLTLIDSYHCSRYNQNTGRLAPEMFEAGLARAEALGL
jgi:uracil-DNA glycosylase